MFEVIFALHCFSDGNFKTFLVCIVNKQGREDDMVVFREVEGGGRHACAAEPYLVRPRYLHAVYYPYT